MAENVQRARRGLRELLTESEFATRRAAGSEYPRTFEDSAREITQNVMHPRCAAVGFMLDRYQAAMGRMLEHSVAEDMHGRLASVWCKRRRPRLDEACATFEDVKAEAMWALRRSITFYEPRDTGLFAYAYPGVLQALDLWWRRQQVPVEIPEKVAKRGGGARRSLEEEEGAYNSKSRHRTTWQEQENYMATLLDVARELGIPAEGLV